MHQCTRTVPDESSELCYYFSSKCNNNSFLFFPPRLNRITGQAGLCRFKAFIHLEFLENLWTSLNWVPFELVFASKKVYDRVLICLHGKLKIFIYRFTHFTVFSIKPAKCLWHSQQLLSFIRFWHFSYQKRLYLITPQKHLEFTEIGFEESHLLFRFSTNSIKHS